MQLETTCSITACKPTSRWSALQTQLHRAAGPLFVHEHQLSALAAHMTVMMTYRAQHTTIAQQQQRG